MGKLGIGQLNLQGRRVLARVDFNVPTAESEGAVVITDDTRIRATLPTLRALIGQGARLILVSHLGRPEGRPNPGMSLKPLAGHLGTLLGQPVAFSDSCVGPDAESAVAAVKPGGVLLLENVRFHPGEESNEPAFAEALAAHADVFVNDAFGTAHRAHASTEGVARILRQRGGTCAAGLLMEAELRFLGDELENPARPFVVILGGAKVSDKILVIDRLLEKADTLLIGGAMTYTFRLADGRKVGKSLVEPDKVEVARAALAKARSRGVQMLLPTDNIVATPVDTGRLNQKGKPVIGFEQVRVNDSLDIPDAEEGLDIGPKSMQAFAAAVHGAKTILWNGPMGKFEDPRFAQGTEAVARAVVNATQQRGAKSLIGGGDSVKALNQMGLASQVTFASTGGGASLEFLEGRILPGVAALSDA